VKFVFDQGAESIPIEIVPSGRGYRATVGQDSVGVEILQAKDGKLDLLVDGKPITAYISSENAKRWVTVNGQTLVLTKSSGAKQRGRGHDHASELVAPMPGQVRAVNVLEGDSVTKGQTLLVLEAMKMEIRVTAPADGQVKRLLVKAGDVVDRGQRLVEMR